MDVLAAVLTLVLLAAVILVVSGPLRGALTPKGIHSRARPGGNTRRAQHPEGPTLEGAGKHAGVLAESDGLERSELEAAREAKYTEIRDTELDYRTGKLSREDYEAVNAGLRREAIEILDRLEALGEQEQGREQEQGPDSPK
jgi:hypothetical protein